MQSIFSTEMGAKNAANEDSIPSAVFSLFQFILWVTRQHDVQILILPCNGLTVLVST